MSKVKIVEVGLRDGLQNEKTILNKSVKIEILKKLVESGLRHVEVGAFVSPKWVPQMADSDVIVAEALQLQKSGQFPVELELSALVPNMEGYLRAVRSGVREIAVFGAASETFSKKNINCSVQESLSRFAEVNQEAKKAKIKVRAYLSTAFGCPYEGEIGEKTVLKLVESYLKLGVYEISVSDTIGVATPGQVRSLLSKIVRSISPRKIAMHFHDTRGIALANVLESLDLGIRVFDASVGGLGGCPYAPGASGNLATEDLLYMLKGMGMEVEGNIPKILEMRPSLEKWIGRTLPSKMSLAGLPTTNLKDMFL